MAYVQTSETRASSVGTMKEVRIDFTLAGGEITAPVVCASLTRIFHIQDGSGIMVYSIAPTFLGNLAFLNFATAQAGAGTLRLFGV